MSRRPLTNLTLLACVLTFSSVKANNNSTGLVTIIFVGDVMIAHDEETGKLIERNVDPFEPCATLLKNSDIAIGNLECVVAEKGDRVRKPYNFRADPSCVPLLKKHFTAF